MVLQLSSVEGITIYGPKPERRGSPLCAFNVDAIHPTDLSTFLDFEGSLALMTMILASASLRSSACGPCLLLKSDPCRTSVSRNMCGIGLGCRDCCMRLMSTGMSWDVQALLYDLGTTARSRCIMLWASALPPEPLLTYTIQKLK